MRQQHFRQAVVRAFSAEDWAVLIEDSSIRQAFAQLSGTEDVERLIFAGYDRLRALKERPPGVASLAQSISALADV